MGRDLSEQVAAAATAAFSEKIRINISVSSQNCNSLNSSSVKNMQKKIMAVSKLGTDIIFLCDIRLGTKFCTVDKHFRANRYKCIAHSNLNKRGVALRYKDTLDLDLLDTIKDTDENILIVNCKIDNTKIILGSVYGPNVDDNRSFFNKIDEFLNRFKGTPVILGGDWNTTVSDLPPRENPEILTC